MVTTSSVGAVFGNCTQGLGNAGTLRIRAESIEVFGTAPGAQFRASNEPKNSEISSAVTSESTGNSGSLRINTKQLIVRDGGTVSVRNEGKGGIDQTGNLEINARTISLNRGSLSATTNSGNGGNMMLNVKDLLFLRNNSTISATAGIAGKAGNGGNITINAHDGVIVAVMDENSDITANAFNGNGGKIKIDSVGLFGFVQRSLEDLERLLKTNDPTKLDPQLLPTNDITAVSLASPTLTGQINIITPDIDPSRGLIALPTVTEQTAKLVSSSCTAFNEAAGGSQFIVTGRGGLPPSPDKPLTSDVIWTDTRLPVTTAQQHEPKTHVAKSKSQPIAINPATGWVRNDKGEVTLISTATEANSVTTPTSCPIK